MSADRRDEESTLPAVVNDLRLAAHAGRVAEQAVSGMRHLAAENAVSALHGITIDHRALSRRMYVVADLLEEASRELREIGRRLEAEGTVQQATPSKS